MLLIYPPAARVAEPPLGLARLAGFLKNQGREVVCLDLAMEGVEDLLAREVQAEDVWTRGAFRRKGSSAAALREPATYQSPDRYGRAVRDLNRVLRSASAPAQASLADYREEGRSPLRRADLMASSAGFESNVFFPLFERRVRPAYEALDDGLVGISLCFLSQALCAFALAGYLKALDPRLRLLLGGGLVTSWLAGGRMPADESFGGLFEAVLSGPGELGLGSLLGLETRARAAPYFGDFSGLGYLSPLRILPYNFSTGCPWKRCSFCPELAEGQPYRSLAAPRATQELRELLESHEPGLFHFTDNEISPLHLRALASEAPGAPWYGFVRFSRALLDPAFCQALAASGCVMLQLGLESGDQAVLDAMGKGTRLDEIATILRNLEDASICAYLYVLFGTPAEDREAALRTRDFLAASAGRIGFLNVAVFNLPASSPEASALETRDFYEGELSLYSEFRHPRGWGRAEVRSFLARDFESVPELRAIVRRTPPVFTSSHAPLFLESSYSPSMPSLARRAQSPEKRLSAANRSGSGLV
jgi:hypothetical protein